MLVLLPSEVKYFFTMRLYSLNEIQRRYKGVRNDVPDAYHALYAIKEVASMFTDMDRITNASANPSKVVIRWSCTKGIDCERRTLIMPMTTIENEENFR